MSTEFLWYIPNTVEPGHRGDDTRDGWGTLEFSTELARTAEEHGWGGALIGAGWGRPDTFTVATALAARTTTFQPLVAIRPGYWQPAHFASAAATLDQLSEGRLLVNIVSGVDNLAAYGDAEMDRPGVMTAPKNSCSWYVDCGARKMSPSTANSLASRAQPCDRGPTGASRVGIRDCISAAPPRRPNRSRPPRPTYNYSGASRWTVSPSGSTASPH
jgi:hypothetical protein